MKMFILILAVTMMTGSTYLIAYYHGRKHEKENLQKEKAQFKKDYNFNYKKVQIERDSWKALAIAKGHTEKKFHSNESDFMRKIREATEKHEKSKK